MSNKCIEITSMPSQTELWNEIVDVLHEARRQLPPEVDRREFGAASIGLLSGTLQVFEEFLEHNELELAWDALVAVAERQKASASCWRILSQAAGLMQLPAKEAMALQRAGGVNPQHGG
jgi:hypothetical protein